jgi:hypothetical protein
MKNEKMSFGNIKDVLSRDEMKQVMAGKAEPIYCNTQAGLRICSGGTLEQCSMTCDCACSQAQ